MELQIDILSAKILIVDDEETTIHLLESILKEEGYRNIRSLRESRNTCEVYKEFQPDLLILDLHMPEKDGFAVMKELNDLDQSGYLPVLVISGEDNQDVRFEALKSGAKDFINKPFDRVEVLIRIRNILDVRLLHNEVRDQNKELEDKVKARTQELYETQLDVMQRLGRAIEYRDSETGMHIIRMSHFASCLAADAGMNLDECELVLAASPLHDIGKIGIPDTILCKPGKLTAEEWEIMKTHTTIGAELLSGSSSKFLQMAREIALTHHEKWDGTGYPNGLKEEGIPLVGRICCLCDVFDALTSSRPYKDPWPVEEAVEEIRNQSGKHFDPRLVECFDKVLPSILKIRERYIDPKIELRSDVT